MGHGGRDKRFKGSKGLKVGMLTVLLAFLTFQPLKTFALSQPPLEPMILSLRESVKLALENNLDIVVERQNPRISVVDIEIEQAIFDLELSTGLRQGTSIRPTASSVEAAIFETVEEVIPIEGTLLAYDMGLKQRLRTGASYDLSFGINRRRGLTVFDPNFSSDLTFTLTQPLLKGFGIAVTQTDLRIARNNHLVSLEAFEIKVADTVRMVEEAYWDLVFQRKNLKVKKEALRAARELLIQNRAKVELGVLPAIEVLVAEAGMASREEDIVVAEKTVRDAEDLLRQAMNLPDEALLEDRAIIPTSEPLTMEKQVHLKEAAAKALTHRPELRQARLEIENRRLLSDEAKNQLWPGLDLQGRAGLEGLGDTYRDSFNRLGSRDFYNWEVGVVFKVPLGNRAARSTYRKRQHELEKSALTLEKLEQQVVIDLKEAVREVETDFKRMDSARRARILAEKKLEAENERFRVGLTTSRNLLDFQKDLADAQNRELKAITDYNKALVKLARIQGTLLSERDIHLSDFNAPPEAEEEGGTSR